jgi:hypothetical protein
MVMGTLCVCHCVWQENPVAMLASDGKHYYAVYDALHHVSGDQIGIAWSADGTCVSATHPSQLGFSHLSNRTATGSDGNCRDIDSKTAYIIVN